YGQLASSHTVTRRFARSFSLSFCTALPEGIRTRIQDGLRSTGASAKVTGERAILSAATWRAPGSRVAGSKVVIGMALLMPPLSHPRARGAGPGPRPAPPAAPA